MSTQHTPVEDIAEIAVSTWHRGISADEATDQISDLMDAYAATKVREALEQAAQACESRIRTGDPGIDTTEVDIEAVACAAAIRALIAKAKGKS